MKKLAPLLALMATGCATLEPPLPNNPPPIPVSWPVGDSYLRMSEVGLPVLTYRQVFTDPRLQTLVDEALIYNRDLRQAAANVAAARAQFQIQRAQQLPQLDAAAGATVTRTPKTSSSSADWNVRHEAQASIPSFEVDLFGRIRSLTKAELERYFASEAAARAVRLTLVSDLASAWVQYAADQSLLVIAQQTESSAQKSVELTRARLRGGVAPRTDLRQAEQVLFTAQADLARQKTALAQDANLIQLLVGGPVLPSLLSPSIDDALAGIAPPVPNLNSTILLRRPDVVEAEYQLRAANAEIGAARAALFPKISLTSVLGLASTALSSLISGGALSVSAGANVGYTIFNGGAGRANVRMSEAQRDAALAAYEKAIQTAFREVADALARRGTINDELAIRERSRASAADNYRLADARYKAGIDNFLPSLDAQRSDYAAQQASVQSKLTAAQNLIDLYQTLGGDQETDPPAGTSDSGTRR